MTSGKQRARKSNRKNPGEMTDYHEMLDAVKGQLVDVKVFRPEFLGRIDIVTFSGCSRTWSLPNRAPEKLEARSRILTRGAVPRTGADSARAHDEGKNQSLRYSLE